MSKEKVTVVITNYNQGHLLPRSISSVKKQSYGLDNIDLIIVDDGSTDDSVDFIESHEVLKDVKYNLIKKENGGTASARNAGARASENNIIAYLDADDEYQKEKVKRSVEEIKRFPCVGCVYSNYIEITTDGKRKKILKPPFDMRLLLNQCIVSTNSVITKAAFDRVNGFDESIKGCEDYDMWLRIYNSGYMIRHIPELLFTYYNHGENKTATFDMNKWAQEEQKIKQRAIKGNFLV